MRKWCATVAIGAMFALPALAQQKSAAGDDSTAKTESPAAAAPASTGNGFAGLRSTRNPFALPEAPRPNAFP